MYNNFQHSTFLFSLLGPFRYRALPPKDIVFKPLNQTREFNAAELMELYVNFFRIFSDYFCSTFQFLNSRLRVICGSICRSFATNPCTRWFAMPTGSFVRCRRSSTRNTPRSLWTPGTFSSMRQAPTWRSWRSCWTPWWPCSASTVPSPLCRWNFFIK